MNQFYRLGLTAVLSWIPLSAANPLFVFPRADCVIKDPAWNSAHPLWRNLLNSDPGDVYVQFGYTSFQALATSIPQGNSNIFVQDPQFRIQPTTFQPGTYVNVFGTIVDSSIGVSWFLNGAFATADLQMQLCPGMSADGGPLPPQFAPVGLASGQTLRLTVATGSRGLNNCSGVASFADSAGNIIRSQSVSTGWIQSTYVEILGNTLTTAGHRVQIQPRFTATGGSCQTSLEVYGSSTGITAALTRPIDPLYLYDFDPQSLSSGQTLRVNLGASQHQSCGASLTFADVNGNTIGPSLNVTLPTGTATYLDLPGSTVGLTGWTGGHVPVRPLLYTIATGLAPNAQHIGLVSNNVLVDETCFASAEIFDTATGYTRSLANPQPMH